jgi:hypothetical protein
MTKDEIFDKIDDVYSEHDGGAIYLSDERTELLKEIIQQAINFIPCCTELKVGHKISFNDWLRVNCEPTRNKNLFIKNKKLQTRFELISMYEKE